jgi:hypothetical protein
MCGTVPHERGTGIAPGLRASINAENSLANVLPVPGKQVVLERCDRVRHLLGGLASVLLAGTSAACHKKKRAA